MFQHFTFWAVIKETRKRYLHFLGYVNIEIAQVIQEFPLFFKK